MEKRELEIYVHIPFCVRKCSYCDFLSFPSGKGTQDAYFDALMREVRGFDCPEQYEVVSVYFGGGTPSLPDPDRITGVLDQIRSRFALREDAEITIECNPGTLTKEKLRMYAQAGFNRLSIGLQSADNELLRKLGRIHTWEMFREEYTDARQAGFSNISVDLMYGLPGQTCGTWADTVKKVLDLPNGPSAGSRMNGPEHLSAYSLIIEEGTVFWDLFHEDAMRKAEGDSPLFLPDEETEERMLEDLEVLTRSAGMHRYEISNYAIRGRESVHNTGYWIRREYVGFGLGASGQLSHARFRNTQDLSLYLKTGAGSAERTDLTREDEIEETMFLGLRMMRGVDLDRFEERFGVRAEKLYEDVIDPLCGKGLLEKNGHFLYLTHRGISLSNLVMAEFLF